MWAFPPKKKTKEKENEKTDSVWFGGCNGMRRECC